MKTLRSVKLDNGITVELVEREYNYQIVSSVGGYPETIAHLDKAVSKFEKRVELYSRFVSSKVSY